MSIFLFNNGLIFQWIHSNGVSAEGGTDNIQNFPLAFPNVCFSNGLGWKGQAVPGNYYIRGINSAQYYHRHYRNVSGTYEIWAIFVGY